MISIVFYLSLMNSLKVAGNNFSIKNIIGYSFVTTFRTFFSVQFVFACFIVQKRFEALNVHLINSMSLKKFNFYAQKSFLTSKYATLYHQLCNGIDAINETFTFQLIFVFAITLVRNYEKLYRESDLTFLQDYQHFQFLWSC